MPVVADITRKTLFFKAQQYPCFPHFLRPSSAAPRPRGHSPGGASKPPAAASHVPGCEYLSPVKPSHSPPTACHAFCAATLTAGLFCGRAVGPCGGLRPPRRLLARSPSAPRAFASFAAGLRLDPFVCVARARAAHPAHAGRRARAAPLALAILTPRAAHRTSHTTVPSSRST